MVWHAHLGVAHLPCRCRARSRCCPSDALDRAGRSLTAAPVSAHADFHVPDSASGSARHCPTVALSMPHIGSSSNKSWLTASWEVTASMHVMPEAAAEFLSHLDNDAAWAAPGGRFGWVGRTLRDIHWHPQIHPAAYLRLPWPATPIRRQKRCGAGSCCIPAYIMALGAPSGTDCGMRLRIARTCF